LAFLFNSSSEFLRSQKNIFAVKMNRKVVSNVICIFSKVLKFKRV